ncbi:MAG TPA: patatin-like phospholipase family protein [Rectinemataceae bacterium]|nr:patatin-like phospholipase family protein [Rectinemataceae bacterium]
MRSRSILAVVSALALGFPALGAQAAAPAAAPATVSPAAQAAAPAPAAQRPRVAVVLSGGSAFGLTYIGVLKEIEAAGIPIDMVVGTSMGSIVGGLYASGYSPSEMDRVISAIDWNTVFMDKRATPGDRFERLVEQNYPLRIGFDSKGLNIGAGLLEGQNILTLFTTLTAQSLDHKDFDHFPVPYRAVATDLVTGKEVVIGSGSIAEAMRASMSIPVVFMPYEYQGRLLVDGGVVDNLPVDVARRLGADIVIAVESKPAPPSGRDELNSSAEIAAQTANLFIRQNMEPNEKKADLLIAPDLSGFNTASYSRAKELIARGEEAGAAAMPELKALAAEIAKARPLVTPDTEPNRAAYGPPPEFGSIRVEGGTPADAVLVRTIFSPLAGRAYSRAELGRAIARVYETGRFDLVKFDLERPAPPGAEGARPASGVPAGGVPADGATVAGARPASGALVGVVRLSPDRTPENAFFAGFDYHGAYSNNMQSDLVLSTALLMRGFTGKNSALLFSDSLVNKVRATLEYFQPLGPFFFRPWGRYDFEYDTYASESVPVALVSKFRTAGGGAWLGGVLGRDADLMVGYSLENVLSGDNWLDLGSAAAAALRASLRWDDRDTTVFAHRGAAFSAYGRWFSPAFGGSLSFAQAELDAMAAIPAGESDTIGLAAFGGTDFAGLVPGARAAEPSYYPSLRHPGMFYGLGYGSSRSVGDDMAAVGLEYRHRIGRISSLVGGEVYLFGNASAAGIAQYGEPSTYDLAPLRYDLCLGAGTRLAREFGIMVGVSLLGNLDDVQPLTPALAIEMGSFSDGRVEDKR